MDGPLSDFYACGWGSHRGPTDCQALQNVVCKKIP
ncbi:MAG: hypothetical protein BWX45_00784 [Deltaproteobacteria bacterium ADurb.Bin002]|jgi:hypothetical protein|nr:MAG: hypothetical protein BWX45_00784 [Deltaproteobacteria bacterium ADurb.Bin002]